MAAVHKGDVSGHVLPSCAWELPEGFAARGVGGRGSKESWDGSLVSITEVGVKSVGGLSSRSNGADKAFLTL